MPTQPGLWWTPLLLFFRVLSGVADATARGCGESRLCFCGERVGRVRRGAELYAAQGIMS
eukprot:4195280-Pyramimonas_sp.AAC.2